MIDKNNIPHKERGEKVVFHIRKHWFVFLKMVAMFAVLFLIPLVAYLFLTINTPLLLVGNIGHSIFLVAIFSYYLIVLSLMLTIWTETYLDVWTITTKKIINRKQYGLFYREVSELDLYRVQDVTATQKGFFPTIFHYGTVYVQTAGAKERFVFEQIPRPYKVAKTIQQLDEKAKVEHHYNNSPHLS